MKSKEPALSVVEGFPGITRDSRKSYLALSAIRRFSMFRIRVHITLLLLLAPALLFAQRVTDNRNMHIVSIFPDGRIVSPMNMQLGRITSEGKLISAANRFLLRLDSEGRVWSAANIQLGRIHRDGRVIDSRNRKLGRVGDNGRITDSANRLLAKADGVQLDWLALWWWWGKDFL
jgi:hypothetical protein